MPHRAKCRSSRHVVLLLLTLNAGGCAGSETQSPHGRLGLGLADTALAGGQPKLALGVSRAILAREPNNVAALARQGDAFHQMGDDARATASYRKALILAPRNIGALIGLGRVALASDPAEASARFTEVLAIEPSNEMALTDRGVAADLSGLHSEAQVDYQRAISIARDGLTDEDNEKLETAEVDYAVSLAISGHASEAVALLRPIASSPDASPRVRQDYAMALTLNGQAHEAAELLVDQMSPENARQALAGYTALAPASAAVVNPDGSRQNVN